MGSHLLKDHSELLLLIFFLLKIKCLPTDFFETVDLVAD